LLPSIKTKTFFRLYLGRILFKQFFIAFLVAFVIFILSIVLGPTDEMVNFIYGHFGINLKIFSLCFSDNFLESFVFFKISLKFLFSILNFGFMITAAVVTGPQSAPFPTSSNPTIIL